MAVATKNGVLNKYSAELTQKVEQVGSRAMLYGTGMTVDDMQKPQIGIASMGWEGNTCNMHLNRLAGEVKKGIQGAGLLGLIFHTIGVSDGIQIAFTGFCGLIINGRTRFCGIGKDHGPFFFTQLLLKNRVERGADMRFEQRELVGR